ncbi:UDP-galactopyranose mutase [Desulfomicrobium macestii]|uniref:UDP-galactopyranose mutase n=2 Tax=Desulfomicrobium macestii TaxID=90731 RepID=A0ABR9H9Q3_9BACT|nr:UDP-galactopyranose mutase [Desulfomicrobium macestii]
MINEHGILVHSYGPHIFHTRRQKVVDFLSRFTAWRSYEHRVMALIEGRLAPVPFNLTSLEICLPDKALKLAKLLTDTFGKDTSIPILSLRQHDNIALRELGNFVYSRIFLGYTQKQWGLSPEEISPAVTARVPFRISHDDRYFTDFFQAMPKAGYTSMFESMLSHPEITVMLDTAFTDIAGGHASLPCIHTGAIDEYFDFSLDSLPYRSARFEFQHLRQQRHLPVAVVNEPDSDIPHTRVCEYRLLTGQDAPETTVGIEFPCAHLPGKTQQSYPVRTEASVARYKEYKKMARTRTPQTIFCGRLGSFCYYNMDDAVLAGMGAAKAILRFLPPRNRPPDLG